MTAPSLRPSREAILAAAGCISHHLGPSPLRRQVEFDALLDAEVHLKCEFLNPVKSFKIRGALNLVHTLVRRGRVARLLTASTGNHGAAMAFACRQYGLPLSVGVPENCDRSKVELIRRFGAQLQFSGRDLDETKERLLRFPLPARTLFVEDGSSAEIVAGTATIGREIAQQLPEVEVAVVPVGNGALIGGLGAALKAERPALRLLGVQSERAPCMALSFAARRPVDTPACDTFASGMAVRVALPAAVELMLDVVDEMVLVSEEAMKEAMRTFYRHTPYLPEGAGAAALAAALKVKPALRGKKVCLLVSGANLDPDLRREITGAAD